MATKKETKDLKIEIKKGSTYCREENIVPGDILYEVNDDFFENLDAQLKIKRYVVVSVDKNDVLMSSMPESDGKSFGLPEVKLASLFCYKSIGKALFVAFETRKSVFQKKIDECNTLKGFSELVGCGDFCEWINEESLVKNRLHHVYVEKCDVTYEKYKTTISFKMVVLAGSCKGKTFTRTMVFGINLESRLAMKEVLIAFAVIDPDFSGELTFEENSLQGKQVCCLLSRDTVHFFHVDDPKSVCEKDSQKLLDIPKSQRSNPVLFVGRFEQAD